MAREGDMDENIKTGIRYAKWGVLCIVVLIVLFGTAYTINTSERGVISTFGQVSPNGVEDGLHFKIPIVQRVVKMNVQTLKYEAELTAASKDLQDVTTKIAINYKIQPDRAPEIYAKIGLGYADVVIYPMEQEINKATTAQFTAVELVTKREEVRTKMKGMLIERLAERGIVIEEVSIVDFKFSPSFSQSIENKVVAEQSALAAKNKLEQVKFEAEQRIAQAQGEAEALRLQKQQVTTELLQLRQIEVQRMAVEKWNGILPQVTGGAVPFISLQQLQQAQQVQQAAPVTP